MVSRRAVFTVLSLFVTSYAVADVTGTWSGNLSGPLGCPNGSVTQTFSVTLALLQSGNLVVGELVAVGPHDACVSGGPTETDDLSLSGSVSGAALTATYNLAGSAHKFSATVNGTSMSVLAETGDGNTLSGTLTQTSTQAPATGFSGTYDGTYTFTSFANSSDPQHPGCVNQTGSLTSTGSFAATVSHIGGAASVSAIFHNVRGFIDDGHGNCTIGNEDGGGTTSGTISGNTFTAPLFNDQGQENGSVTITFSGNTLTGSTSTTREKSSFTATRTGGPSAFPPPLITFTADPSSIGSGDSATLTWSAQNSSSVSIDNGIGTKPAFGSVTVSPAQSTTYTLTATGPGGNSTATATVIVAAAAPKIVVSRLPSGMLQPTGSSGATDSLTITNAGTASGNVTLTQSGNFFAVSQTSFTLPAGSSQVAGITANSQPAGTYDGSITISNGPSVPVHLLVAAPPTAPVNPKPSIPRTDVSAPAGQNPSGSLQFSNSGTGTVTGIAVADVPWIVPQTGAINIAPGQTATVNFNIDRSQRPDSASPAGGVAGRISLVFLTPGSGKRAVANGNAPNGSVSVTIVDVVKPGVAPGTPPALQPGEVALYVLGLRTANRFNGDLTISSRSAIPSISDLKMYFRAGGNPAQIGTVPAFAPSAGIAFPAISKNVFGIVGTGGGTLQFRSAQTPSIALSAVVALNDPNPAIASATALPILRSDRGIGAGEKLVFAGAQDSLTTVWIQEVSGIAGHVSIQYLSQSGSVVGTDSADVPGFTAIASAAPDGTRAVVVANDSTTGGRFDGYAAINDPTTNDGWIITDSLHHWANATGPLIMPLIPSAPNDIYITNTSSNPATISLEGHRETRKHVASPAGGSPLQLTNVAPMSTAFVHLPAESGFVRISAPANITATGRVTLSASGASFGTSLPAVPAGAAIGNGQGKRFTGVDDASAKTLAARTPATDRSALILIEASGQSATVRITLRYNFVAGATVSSQGVSSRDFTIGPLQMAVVSDLARSIIGAQRDTFGDLRNMQIDVDVIDGSGTILPFVESIDNASGDIVVRAE